MGHIIEGQCALGRRSDRVSSWRRFGDERSHIMGHMRTAVVALTLRASMSSGSDRALFIYGPHYFMKLRT